VFALRNPQNEIVSLYFRSSINDSDQRHYYLKDRQGLYPGYPKPETQKLLITESIIDCATLQQLPILTSEYSLLSLFGTNGLSKEHSEAISQLTHLEEIIFFLNGDKAGCEAVKKHAATLQQLKPLVKIYNIEPPEGEDINSMSIGHDSGLFMQMLTEKIFIHGYNDLSKEFMNEENSFLFSNESSQTPLQINNTGEQIIPSSNQLETTNPFKIHYATSSATYYILGGLPKGLDHMKITLAVEHPKNGQKSRSKIDLYEDKQVEKLSKEVAEKLNLNKNQVETDLNNLTDLLDAYREIQATSQEPENAKKETYQLTANERSQALEQAQAKNLMEQIQEKLSQTGIVAEEENKVFLFTVAASHIQENPSSALIQGSSGSGKTRLLKQIYACMPEENKKIYSRCSEKMLYNVPKYYFKNKLICFEDVDGLGEEAEYAWRELVSNGELISGVSHKDEHGNISVKEITVCGPITSIACTTKGAIYADNMSRLFLIAIDESKAQTDRINDYQGKEAAGLINKQAQKKAIQQLQNYVRLLQPYEVHNPHAVKLRLPQNIKDGRRLFKLYLYFIDMITVLHQYQRQKNQQNKLIATKADCQIAKDLMLECIMLKMDELDGSLRQFFERLKDYIKKQNNDNYEFTQREIREELQVKKTQLSYYMNELISLEYVQQTSSHINKGNRYKVLHFDNYRKMREEVKQYLQTQIDQLANDK
jgi:DNA primase